MHAKVIRRFVQSLVWLACLAAHALAQDRTQALRMLQAEADALYRASAPHAADAELVRLYEALATGAPQHAHRAWLRIGNIHQRAGAVGAAIDAYRRTLDAAKARRSPDADEEESRRKALLNLALLGLDQAHQALAQLPPLPAASAQAAQLESLARRVDGMASVAGRQRQEVSGRQAGAPVPEAPHVVERYTASARRNAVKAAKGSLHVDPADELPARPVPKPRSRLRESLPDVEYLLGDPQRFKPAADEGGGGRKPGTAAVTGKPGARERGPATTAGAGGGDAAGGRW